MRPEESGSVSRTSKSALATVYLTVFIDLFGFGIILPALPYYAQHLGASGLWLGVLFTAYCGAQLFGAALLGRWSDRVERRPVLLLSLLGSALAFTLCGFATTLPWLIAARALAGAFGGSIAAVMFPPTLALVTELADPRARGSAMGAFNLAGSLGFALGPLVGAWAHAAGGFRFTFVLSGAIAIALALAAAPRIWSWKRAAP